MSRFVLALVLFFAAALFAAADEDAEKLKLQVEALKAQVQVLQLQLELDKKKTTNSIAAPFQDNGDGTITDSTTGLIWQKSPVEVHLSGIESYVKELALPQWRAKVNGDWQLPSINELKQLYVDLAQLAQGPATKAREVAPFIWTVRDEYAASGGLLWDDKDYVSICYIQTFSFKNGLADHEGFDHQTKDKKVAVRLVKNSPKKQSWHTAECKACRGTGGDRISYFSSKAVNREQFAIPYYPCPLCRKTYDDENKVGLILYALDIE